MRRGGKLGIFKLLFYSKPMFPTPKPQMMKRNFISISKTMAFQWKFEILEGWLIYCVEGDVYWKHKGFSREGLQPDMAPMSCLCTHHKLQTYSLFLGLHCWEMWRFSKLYSGSSYSPLWFLKSSSTPIMFFSICPPSFYSCQSHLVSP